jgi:hypothetical protein
MLVREVQIKAASGGFGEFEAVRSGGEPVDLADWLSSSDYDVQLLADGVDLAAPAEDIRGRIHNQPSRVYVLWDGHQFVGYAGLDEVAE